MFPSPAFQYKPHPVLNVQPMSALDARKTELTTPPKDEELNEKEHKIYSPIEGMY